MSRWKKRYRRDARYVCTTGALTLAELSQLLWAAQGVTAPSGYRTAPSAGALYPLEIYVVVGEVVDLAAGIYRYLPGQHALVRLTAGDRRGALGRAALDHASVRGGAAVLVLAALFARTTVKYGERGDRYVHMEVGSAAQDVYLQAVSLQLGTVFIGAFDDDTVKRILTLDAEQPLCLLPIGRPGR